MDLVSTGNNKGFVAQEQTGTESYIKGRNLSPIEVSYEEAFSKAFTNVDVVPAYGSSLVNVAHLTFNWSAADFSGDVQIRRSSMNAENFNAPIDQFFAGNGDLGAIHDALGSLLATSGAKSIPLNAFGIAELNSFIQNQGGLFPIAFVASDGGHAGTVVGQIVGDVRIVTSFRG